MNTSTSFDPTLLEALVGALLTLVGAGAGFGVRRTRAEPAPAQEQPSPLYERLTQLVDRQCETAERLGDVIRTLDALVREDLRRLDSQAKARARAQRRLTADLDAISDALDIIVSHIGAQLPEQARVSINAKLARRHRDEVSGLH